MSHHLQAARTQLVASATAQATAVVVHMLSRLRRWWIQIRLFDLNFQVRSSELDFMGVHFASAVALHMDFQSFTGILVRVRHEYLEVDVFTQSAFPSRRGRLPELNIYEFVLRC